MPQPNEPRIPESKRFQEGKPHRLSLSYGSLVPTFARRSVYHDDAGIRWLADVRDGDSVLVLQDSGHFRVRVMTAKGEVGYLYREFLKQKEKA